jgi:hypothetical protein
MSNQKYIAVQSVADGLKELDTNPDVMFAFISLNKNDATLQGFTDNIQGQGLTSFFNSVFNSVTLDHYKSLFPDQTSIFNFEEHTYCDEYRLTLNPSLEFEKKSGGKVHFEAPENYYIHEVAVQCNNGRSINREPHKDKRIFTLNLYSEGQGIKYHIDNYNVKLQSPIITMHRGKGHKFGQDAAVLHQGQGQTGRRVNIAFELDTTLPQAILL